MHDRIIHLLLLTKGVRHSLQMPEAPTARTRRDEVKTGHYVDGPKGERMRTRGDKRQEEKRKAD